MPRMSWASRRPNLIEEILVLFVEGRMRVREEGSKGDSGEATMPLSSCTRSERVQESSSVCAGCGGECA